MLAEVLNAPDSPGAYLQRKVKDSGHSSHLAHPAPAVTAFLSVQLSSPVGPLPHTAALWTSDTAKKLSISFRDGWTNQSHLLFPCPPQLFQTQQNFLLRWFDLVLHVVASSSGSLNLTLGSLEIGTRRCEWPGLARGSAGITFGSVEPEALPRNGRAVAVQRSGGSGHGL